MSVLRQLQDEIRNSSYFSWNHKESDSLFVSDKMPQDAAVAAASEHGVKVKTVSPDKAKDVTGRPWYGKSVYVFYSPGTAAPSGEQSAPSGEQSAPSGEQSPAPKQPNSENAKIGIMMDQIDEVVSNCHSVLKTMADMKMQLGLIEDAMESTTSTTAVPATSAAPATSDYSKDDLPF